ncbi:MAG: TIGR03560 family F420-dependent LLM class oxidoreductase [Sporichthyaceae bacterium]
MTSVKFGVFVPQGWKMELASIADPVQKWATALEIATLAEELGYDSLWVYDHFHNVPKPAGETMFECWTTMAAISQRTSRIMLGQMVGCAPYRNPALLAKITSNIDVMSGGRLIWGIGAGWYRNEFDGYGYEFASNADRIRAMAETVQIVTALWSQPSVTYQGRYFSLDRGQCDPKPVQSPRPAVLIGGGGPTMTLKYVARLADASNFGGNAQEWAAKAEILKDHCKAEGRDYDEIQKTWSPEVLIRETEAELADCGARSIWGENTESWRQGNLVGTPEQVAEKIAAYVDLGCTGFYTWCTDYPDTTTLRLLAEKVMPHFR